MNLYTTTIYLSKSSTNKDFTRLHNEMMKKGFWRYPTKTNEYQYGSDKLTTNQVLSKANTAANKIDKGYCVVITTEEITKEWFNK